MKSLSIVIPAFNEELRLPATLNKLQAGIEAQRFEFDIQEVIVVDDGSVDKTASVVQEFSKRWNNLKFISFPINRGKGAAVHEGLKAATCPWVLVADADMATPWDEMNKFSPMSESYDLIMGSRALPESQIEIRQHLVRQTMGKSFNKLLRALVRLPYNDTQCGFKLIRNDESFRQQILPRLQVERFAWDVELLLCLQKFNKRILEFPVLWRHQEASRVRIFRDSFEMLFTVLKLRFRGL
ncbi:putative glycosyltransferase CsbB [compost metagenome]